MQHSLTLSYVDRDSPGLRQGISRELRKHVTILEQEIVELDQV